MPSHETEVQPPNPRVAYTASEAAELLGVNVETIYRLITRGKLRTVPGLRHKRIPVGEFDRFAKGI
jgi:excisionase family DNA binding protein